MFLICTLSAVFQPEEGNGVSACFIIQDTKLRDDIQSTLCLKEYTIVCLFRITSHQYFLYTKDDNKLYDRFVPLSE